MMMKKTFYNTLTTPVYRLRNIRTGLTRQATLAAFSLLTLTIASCQKYLDARPDKTQVVPQTYADLQALMDNVDVMNRGFPSLGEAAADNYYLRQTEYDALALAVDKTLYNWQPNGVVGNGRYSASYQVIFYANQVLESLGTVPPADPQTAAALKGTALFFRAYGHLEVAGVFAGPYRTATAAKDLGIALRLGTDFNVRSVRSTLQQTYDQILQDFKASATLLPLSSEFSSRPVKAAAYAALARTFLAMGSYQQAGLYADSCLAMGAPLLDYNTISTSAANPFPRFNKETVFYAASTGVNTLVTSKFKVDSTLFASYAVNDLRRTLFFKSNGDGTYAFKGNYDGAAGSTLFSGLATDELYLIAAECSARAGNKDKALGMLDVLLLTRWKKGTYVPQVAADAAAALRLVLQERRKELIFRGSRWTDLRRLNQEQDFQTTLVRRLNGTEYRLEPNDLRYVFLIPETVIAQTGMQQNPR